MTSLQQTAMLGGAASAKTASYTLVAADAGTAISMSNASATTITVNTALFAAGDTVQITNLGAGVCTITAGTATVNTSASLALAQYESGTLDFTSTSAAIFVKGAGGASGGMTLLSTTSLSGATTTISSISQDYISLKMYITGVSNATADGNFQISPNSLPDLNAVRLEGDNTSVEGYGNSALRLNYQTLPRADAQNVWVVTFDNYTSATRFKPFQVTGYYDTGNNRRIFVAGTWYRTAALSSLVFSNSGGNLSTGTVLLYGVK